MMKKGVQLQPFHFAIGRCFFSLQDSNSNMPELKLKHTIQIQTGLKCVAKLGRTLRDVAVFKVKSGRGLLTHLTG
jgi:hypothetical protein